MRWLHVTHEGEKMQPGLNVGYMYDDKNYWWARAVLNRHTHWYYVRLRWMPSVNCAKWFGFGNSNAKLVLIIQKIDQRLELI